MCKDVQGVCKIISGIQGINHGHKRVYTCLAVLKVFRSFELGRSLDAGYVRSPSCLEATRSKSVAETLSPKE